MAGSATTSQKVMAYKSSHAVFEGLIREIRELSKKKADATLIAGKVKIINRVLNDLREFLSEEPEAKYLDPLNDDELPQNSDAVLVMVQYESALRAFHSRYYRSLGMGRGLGWITSDADPEDDDADDY